jgi:hypothetical protein
MDIKIHLLITFEQKKLFGMGISKEWTRKVASKDFKFDTYWKKEKTETKNKMERRRTHSYGRMWSPRWKLGGQTSLEIACRNTLSYVTERQHTFTWFDPGPLVIFRASCLCRGGETTPLNCDHQRTHCSYPDDICVWSNSIIIIIIIITKSWGTNG